MEASAFSPVNMEQGGDIVVPTIYRSNGGDVDDSDDNFGGFGSEGFGDSFGDLGAGGASNFGPADGDADGNLQGFYDYYTDPQNVNVEGTITGDKTTDFQSGEDSSPTLADLYRSQGYSPNEIAGIAGYRGGLSDVERDEFNFGKGDAQSLQDAIDRGQFKGAGGTFGRTLESLGLATHGKGIYGPLEAFTPGKALYYDQEGYEAGPRSDEIKDADQRGQYNADNLIGGVDADPAVKLFDMYMSDPFRNKSETIAETASRFEAENPGMTAPTEAFGYSRNSSTLTSDLMDSLNDSRGKGALQGGLMMLGAAINPVGLIGNLSTRYEDGKTKNMYSDVTDVVQDTLGLNTGKGKGIGDAVEIINDPAGYLSRNIDTVGKSVPDLGPIEDVKAEQARQADIAYNLNENRTGTDMSKEFKTRVFDESLYPRYETKTQLPTGEEVLSYDERFTGDPRGMSAKGRTPKSAQDDLSLGSLAPDPREAPEQNMFAKGISALVDLFGGPEAASRNNLDTSFDSGNDQPERRVAPPKIPEVLSAAIEQAEPIPVEDSGLSARELSLGPQVNTLILQGVDPSTAIRQVGIDQGEFTVAQILKLLGVS
tara:strand:- start:48 stop:1838 length:1791 start_codon:yes stop_codon:yes gene_type:complete